VAHYITDAVTSRWTGKLFFFVPSGNDHLSGPWFVRTEHVYGASYRHWFFVVIGFDQLLHYIQLALTWRWLHG
jgi:hypothetical protein